MKGHSSPPAYARRDLVALSQWRALSDRVVSLPNRCRSRAAADGQSCPGAGRPVDRFRFARLLRDVGGDWGFFSKAWPCVSGIGGAATGIAIWDSDIANEAAEPLPPPTELLDGGDFYGGPAGQWPLAIGWWAIGHFSHNAAAADAGRDLLRAQISAASWTYLIKFATNRQRPNGDPRAFPSGHTSATFATATVLQQHYGWKVGVLFYLLGVYAGASDHGREALGNDVVLAPPLAWPRLYGDAAISRGDALAGDLSRRRRNVGEPRALTASSCVVWHRQFGAVPRKL